MHVINLINIVAIIIIIFSYNVHIGMLKKGGEKRDVLSFKNQICL